MRPRYAAGMGASLLLAPVLLSYGCGTQGAPEAFELTAAPPQLRTGATWLERSRIVDEGDSARVASVPPTTTAPKSIVGEHATITPAPATTTVEQATTTAPRATTTSTAVPRPSSTVATLPAATPATTPVTLLPGVPVTLPTFLTPVAPASKPVGGHKITEHGTASWFNWYDATCAHRTAPFGTIVKVTRVSTGSWTTCEVADWGPADTTRVIDLSMDTFERLASADAGLIDVVIEW